MRRGTPVLVAAAIAAAVLAGCDPTAPKHALGIEASSSAATEAAATEPAATEPAVQSALRPFYQQHPAWTACGELQCATLTVPMDYAQPQDGRTFTLPLIRAAATEPDGCSRA